MDIIRWAKSDPHYNLDSSASLFSLNSRSLDMVVRDVDPVSCVPPSRFPAGGRLVASPPCCEPHYLPNTMYCVL